MRILIADDHRLIIEGVKLKLAELGEDIEFVVAMDVETLRERLLDAQAPDLAIIDLTMPGTDGREHLLDVLKHYVDMPVVVLSGSESPQLMRELLELGVRGFIPKAYSPEVMLSAVRLVLAGGVYVPPLLLQRAGLAPDNPPDGEGASLESLREKLTERQIDVLRLLAKGKPNKVIARDLGISEGTVKIHLAAIFRALSVRNRVEAVVASRRTLDL